MYILYNLTLTFGRNTSELGRPGIDRAEKARRETGGPSRCKQALVGSILLQRFGRIDSELRGDAPTVVLIGTEEVAQLAHLHLAPSLSEKTPDAGREAIAGAHRPSSDYRRTNGTTPQLRRM